MNADKEWVCAKTFRQTNGHSFYLSKPRWRAQLIVNYHFRSLVWIGIGASLGKTKMMTNLPRLRID